MKIPPQPPPGSFSLIRSTEGKERNREAGGGEMQHALPIKGFSGLRELIVKQFLSGGTAIPPRKGIPLIERFLSEGPPTQYLSRIALAKQFVEKDLPLRLESLRVLYNVLEGSAEDEAASRGENHFPPDVSEAPAEAHPFYPSENPRVKDLLDTFNRRKNKKGQWIVLPFSCFLEGVPYHGCLRLYKEGGTSSKVVLSVRRHGVDGLPWYFVWFPHDLKRPVRMYPPSSPQGKVTSIPGELLETFREKLRKVGFILDDNKSSSAVCDGFDESEKNLQNIDIWI